MIEDGKTVSVFYKGSFDDGTVFDTNEGKDALQFKTGADMIIPGFEKAVREMEIGETKTVHIPCAEAYGEYDESQIDHQSLDYIPNAQELPVGKNIYFMGDNGEPISAKVLKIEDGEAYFDFNHPLAGKDLNFDITLDSIED